MPASLAPPPSWVDIKLPSYPYVTGVHHSISAASMGWFCYALLWAVILLISFNGWGRGAARLFRVGQLPTSVACSLGIAVILFLGGILNLLHALYVPVLFALVAIGFALYLWRRGDRPGTYRWRTFWEQLSPGARLLLVATLIILALRVAATVRLGPFDNLDDGPAYLVFPHKLLAIHDFAFDPFSDRRVISSVGGAYLLQAMVIAATSLVHIGMADRTLGLILLAVALFDLGIAFELSGWQIAILEFLAYLVPQPAINLTFIVLPTSLLIAMVWFILKTNPAEDHAPARYAWMAGMAGGAVIALKSTFLPCVGAFALIPYLMLPSSGKGINRLRWPLAALGGSLTVLALWMIAMKMNSGTYLFPIFGAGVDYASYGWFHEAEKFTSTRSIIKVFLQAIPLLILAAIQFTSGARDRRVRLSESILIASALAITALNYKSGADFIWRYNFPQFFCAVIVFYVAAGAIYRKQPASSRALAASWIGLLSMVMMLFYYDAAGHNPRPFRQVHDEVADSRIFLHASLTGLPLASPSTAEEYNAVERSIPPHSAALEDVGRPYLFDYKMHRIYVMDWPGAASPLPGWPLGQSSSRLASYLVRNSVRYVVYDYRYSAWDSAWACRTLGHPRSLPWELYVLYQLTVLTNHQLDLLHVHYRSIYDDGTIAVIDLDRPVPNVSADGPAWTLKTDINEMCPTVMDQYLKNPLSEHAEWDSHPSGAFSARSATRRSSRSAPASPEGRARLERYPVTIRRP